MAGLALLLRAGRGWPRVAGAGVAVLAGAVALSAVAQWLGLQGFLKQYAEQTAGLGLTSFTAPTDALGLSLSFRTLLAAGPGQALLARAAQAYDLLIVAGRPPGAGAGRHLARDRGAGAAMGTRLLRVATLAGGLLYLVLFFRPLSYVYGWFKAQSFVAFLLVGAVVGGALWLWPRLRGRWARAGGTMALLVPTAALAADAGAAALAVSLASALQRRDGRGVRDRALRAPR